MTQKFDIYYTQSRENQIFSTSSKKPRRAYFIIQIKPMGTAYELFWGRREKEKGKGKKGTGMVELTRAENSPHI